MEEKNIDIQKMKAHWISRSESDYKTMLHLYKAKDYHWALFMGHLVIERLLKALIISKTETHPPFTHDLRRLARLSEIALSEKQKKELDTVTTFNLNARYDDYKEKFYQKCTPGYTEEWITNIKTLRKWIKEKLQ